MEVLVTAAPVIATPVIEVLAVEAILGDDEASDNSSLGGNDDIPDPVETLISQVAGSDDDDDRRA